MHDRVSHPRCIDGEDQSDHASKESQSKEDEKDVAEEVVDGEKQRPDQRGYSKHGENREVG